MQFVLLYIVFTFSQQKIFIEYIMLDGVNDEEQHAHKLGKLLETFEVVSINFSLSMCILHDGMMLLQDFTSITIFAKLCPINFSFYQLSSC